MRSAQSLSEVNAWSSKPSAFASYQSKPVMLRQLIALLTRVICSHLATSISIRNAKSNPISDMIAPPKNRKRFSSRNPNRSAPANRLRIAQPVQIAAKVLRATAISKAKGRRRR